MKLHKLLKNNVSHILKTKKKYSLLGISFLFITALITVFFVTRGVTPHTAELSYIEHSVLGKEAGTMIPASCNSFPPTSHFAGDCTTTCPSGVGVYDPYFDPTGTGCPAPSVSLSITPTTVAYGSGYNSLTLSSSGADSCHLYSQWENNGWVYNGGAPVNYTWGASGALPATISYVALCYNGANGTWSNTVTTYVEPQIPSSPTATCNNAAGTSATLSWGASANANKYYLRIEYPASEACQSGWQRGGGSGNTCYPNPDSYPSTSYSFTTTPNQIYPWWVHAGNNYTASSPVGNNLTCNRPSGAIALSAASCAIATGASSCNVNASWNVSYPFNGNVSTLVRDKPNRTDYTLNSAANVPVTVYGPPASSLTTLSLVNSGLTIDSKTVSATCASGGWDTSSGACADPQVVSAAFLGQYYPVGTLSIVCSGSDSYSVEIGGVPFIPVTAYSGPVTINNISIGGNYTIQCRHGSVSSQTARRYDAVPPPAVVRLNVSPTTLSKDDDVTVKWDVTFPTNACTLTAKVVCANNSCTAAQTAAQTALNTILTSTTTDADDKATTRPLQTAIKTVAPGHKDNDPVIIVTDWKALGKKTLRILYTTDLTYQCSPTSKETKRIQVTRSIEQ